MTSITQCDICRKKQKNKASGWIMLSMRSHEIEKIPGTDATSFSWDICPACNGHIINTVQRLMKE